MHKITLFILLAIFGLSSVYLYVDRSHKSYRGEIVAQELQELKEDVRHNYEFYSKRVNEQEGVIDRYWKVMNIQAALLRESGMSKSEQIKRVLEKLNEIGNNR